MNSINNLCRKRKIRSLDIQTPLLIPSFSSKNFNGIGETWEYLREQIRDVVLLSAYDLFYGHINLPQKGADVVFIDSGGYETAVEYDLSETVHKPYQPKEWDAEKHCSALEKVDTLSALVLVSFDNPNQNLQTQINHAREFFAQHPTSASDFLLKPHQMPFMEPNLIVSRSDELKHFDILGITEKELGETIQDRVLNLMNLRASFDQKGLDIPIHIFGCLDPSSVWLYYLCGADIFDGLTWLRFVFQDNLPVYRNSWAVRNKFITYNEKNLQALAWQNNLATLKDQQREMGKYASQQDVDLIPKEVVPLIHSLGLHLH